MTSPYRKPKPFSHGPLLILFSFFLIVAILTVLALEYLEYRSGRYSFVFTRLIKRNAAEKKSAAIQQDFVQLLEKSNCEFQYVRDAAGVFHFKISVDANQVASLLAQIKNMVQQAGGKVELADTQKEKSGTLSLYQAFFGKIATHMLLISTLAPGKEAEQKKEVPEKRPADSLPRIAIVIDDVGYTETIADQLHNLGIPITAAVIPDAPFAASQAEKIHRFGLEEIIHLPMQSKNSQNHDSDTQLITGDSSTEEIAAMIRRAKKIVPYALGVNNHMGSLVTSRPELIENVLQEIKRENLFFIDSRTTPDSIAFEKAKALNMKTLYRDVFLDSTQTYPHTLAQVRLLVEMARRQGEALAIGHPLDTTLKALKDSLDWIRSQRVEIVFAAQLLK